MARRRRKNRTRISGALALAEPQFAPNGERPRPLTESNLQTEYVAGNYLWWGGANLPSFRPDPNAPEITFDTYRQMLNDPEVSAGIRTLTMMVLGDGIQLSPAFESKPIDDDASEFSRAEEITAFCERNLAGLRKPLRRTLTQMIEGALSYGHKAAEITWKTGEGIDSGRLVLDKLSVKPHNALDFVVDRFWNLIGFTPRRFAETREIIPFEKFLILTFLEEDEDPRGRSTLRAAYNGWNFKQLIWPEYKRWLDNCALPSIIGRTPPKGQSEVQRTQDGTNKTISPSQAMLQALIELKNASVAVLPNGSEVDQLNVISEGAGFDRALAVADGQITKAILYQMLATNEAKFGTRAQSETHMSVLDLLVWSIKTDVAELLTDLLKRAITYNFGDDSLRFAPIVSLGDSERRDWSQDAAAAALIEPAITDSQWNAITTQLGLPAPQPGEEPRRRASQPVQPAGFPPEEEDEE
jgi:Protein of unknown function (DUF935)